MTGVLQVLNGYYHRIERKGEVETFGFTRENISYVVCLSPEGILQDVLDIRVPGQGKPRPKRIGVPRPKRTSNILPNFLWDKTAYAFGVDSGKSKRLREEHASFVKLHFELLSNLNEPHARALLNFLSNWAPDKFCEPLFTSSMLDESFVFRLEGEQRFFHEVPELKEIWLKKLHDHSGCDVICLITGEVGPVIDSHAVIKNVRNAQTSGAYLVSFDSSAFNSYGKSGGANAPVSEGAAFRYGAALNRMLDRDSRNRLMRPVGDATLVFWADASQAGESAAQAAEHLFAFLAEPPDDETEAVKLRDALDDLAAGRAVPNLDLKLVEGTRFHVLGLAPNAARLSVRYWLEDDFSEFAKRLAEHYRDLAIEPAPWGAKLPSVSRLLVNTTVRQSRGKQEKFDDIPPLLAGEVMRAVLSGARYPRTLLSAAITRLRAGDVPWAGWHAAAAKAYLNRSEKETVPMALDPDNPSAAYQLGRLFAVLESAQYAALGRVNAPISTRYYGSASATPARIFGPLLRGLRHHVADAMKRGRGGWIDRRVGEIMAHLPAELPHTLRLEEQGRFAIGYYHERAFRSPQSEEAKPDETDTDNQGAD